MKNDHQAVKRSSVTSLTGQLSGRNEALFRKKFDLLLTLAVLISLFIMQGWYNPQEAQAWPTKYSSCSATSCHGGSEATATISTAINGTTGTTVTGIPTTGGSFEIDYKFTNIKGGTSYSGVGVEVAVPSGWTVGPGTSNYSPFSGAWNTVWNNADGVGAYATADMYSTSGVFPNSPDGYTINYNGSSWDTGNRNAAYDNASAGDLDGTANSMGSDVVITVPPGTAAGTYYVVVVGAGHNAGGTKAHVEQQITVIVGTTYTVTPSVGTGSGTISPNTAQAVASGATTAFTLTPSANYHIVNVTGTCPSGSLVGSTYTTGAVTANCTVVANFALDTRTVTPSVGTGSGTISPSTVQTIDYGTTTAFTVTPSANYHIVNVTGTCPSGSLVGSTYTTGAITANCTVIANFAIDTFTVTPSVTGSGTISPNTAQTVNYNGTTAFTVTPTAGNHIVNVTGTCGGSLAGSTFTTSAITANCTVIANFAIDTFTVTPSVTGSGTISPNTAQTVNYNGTTAFTLTPSANYHIVNVTGTCPSGSLVGSTYTTGAVTANCTVVANFALDTRTVTPSVGTGSGTISPSTMQTIDYGTTAAFTLTPSAGNHIVNVTGTCGGSLAGDTFTTSAVTANCTVIANFAIDTFTVTPSVTGSGTISPDTAQTIDYGTTTTFTVTPSANYHIVNVTGTCGGSLAGDTFTTSAVTADCTVIANFAMDTFTVTPSVTGSGTISPDTAQTVNYNGTTAFTLTPSANYHIVNVTGTCGGSLAGDTYTTSAVTANCTVIANFAIDAFTVTPSAGANGSITPNTPQTVNSGATTAFTVTPDSGYHIDTVGGTCGGSLAGNTYTTAAVTANCTVDATFAADQPAIEVTPVSPFDFGSVNVGTSSAPQTFTINNVGDADLVIGTIGNGTSEYVISSDNCSGQTVAASGSCTLQVTFTPSTYGWQMDTMTIPSNAPGSPTLVTLEGTGEASNIGVSPISPFGFGSVNVGSSSSPQTFTISNTGNVGLVIGTINSGTSEYAISSDNCSGQTVAASGNCTLDVTFSPATYGASAGLMSIPSNDPETPTFSVTLNGTGEASNIGVSPISPFGFGSVNVGSSLLQTFTVSNTGTVGLVIGTITSSSGEFEIFSDTCSGTTVPASGSCTLDVLFAPSTSGTRTSELQIPSNDPDSPTFTVSLNGTGVQYTVTPSAGANGSISPNTPQTVNYNNTTAFTVTPDSGYHIDTVGGTCGGSLEGNTYTTAAISADCTVDATFAIDTFTVTPSAGANGSITPNTPQMVNSGATTAFTVTPDSGYHIDTVGGTCGGSLAGSTFTTSAVTADCTVDATFAADNQTYTILSNSVNGVISCTPTTVDHGGEFTCSILPNPGYYIALLTDNAVDVTDSIIGGNYTVTNVTADHTISGTFLSCDIRVVSGVDEYCYSSLSTAYSEAASGDLFKIKGITFSGDLDLNKLLSVIFAGGYDSGFTAQTGWTTIAGSLIISNGIVEVEYIDIQ